MGALLFIGIVFIVSAVWIANCYWMYTRGWNDALDEYAKYLNDKKSQGDVI